MSSVGALLCLFISLAKTPLFFSPLGWTQLSSGLLNNSVYCPGHFYMFPSVPPDIFGNVMRHSWDQGGMTIE
jgi:hypothetical protein